jgi:hypothetical protein
MHQRHDLVVPNPGFLVAIFPDLSTLTDFNWIVFMITRPACVGFKTAEKGRA